MQSLLTNLRNLSIIVFFITLSWGVWKTVVILDQRSLSMVEVSNTTTAALVAEFHSTNAILKTTTDNLDRRILSIEGHAVRSFETIEANTFQQLEATNHNLELVANSVVVLVEEHKKLAQESTLVVQRTNDILDCRYNDLCLSNLVTDVMIDSRNMVRNGSKTFQMVNANIPKLVTDIDKVTTSLADGFPRIVGSTAAVSQNIERITKPKWYDRMLSWGVNGSLLYFNINRGRLMN